MLIIHNEIPSIHHDLRMFNQIKELSKYYKVTLLAIPFTQYNNSDAEVIKKYCNLISPPYFSKDFENMNLISRYRFLIKRRYKEYLNSFKKESKLIKDHFFQVFCLKYQLNKLLSKKKFDYIQVEHFYLGPVIYNVKNEG